MQDKLPHCIWPPEWHPQRAVWLSWPHRPELWYGHFLQIQELFLDFMLRLSQYAEVCCLVPNQKEARDCQKRLEKKARQKASAHPEKIQLQTIPTDDIWIRDYGPLWVFLHENTLLQDPGLPQLTNANNLDAVSLDAPSKTSVFSHKKSSQLLLDFRFNAWGEKYGPYGKDDSASKAIAKCLQKTRLSFAFVLEGGALETSGETLLLAHDSILLPSRKLPFSQSDLAKKLRRLFGCKEMLWIKGCLPGDDTDGHVDMLARFASPRKLLLAEAPKSHPAHKTLSNIKKQIQTEWQQTIPGRQIVPLPVPKQSYFQGRPLPRSYLNFLITNQAVFVPTYKEPEDKIALKTIAQAFPNHNIEAVYAGDLILEGGAIHCMTMPEFL